MADEVTSDELVVASLQDFLEKVPPGTWATIENITRSKTTRTRGTGTDYVFDIEWPVIKIHCTDDDCGGMRNFETQERVHQLAPNESLQRFVSYQCGNCKFESKTYAILLLMHNKEARATLFKYGELPAFGPPLPPKLISLIRPGDLFKKGRRAENQGLGIAAFAYYRRVVEGQKDRIFDQLIKAAQRLSAPSDLISELQGAKGNIQFKAAIESVKQGFPEPLMIEGQNPLTLLHGALSADLHAGTDEDCLESARDIRIVMSELAGRLAQVLTDDAELKASVSRLLSKRSARKNADPDTLVN